MEKTELTHSMAHYLLTIHKLKEVNGYARVTDIARDMKLTKGSVSIALGNLKKRKLIIENESKFYTLSADGHQQVHEILSSRTLLYYFLKDFVQVADDVAHRDSCLMEHLMSDETREKFFKLMQDLANPETKNTYRTDFDFKNFSNHNEFLEAQKGDSYLNE